MARTKTQLTEEEKKFFPADAVKEAEKMLAEKPEVVHEAPAPDTNEPEPRGKQPDPEDVPQEEAVVEQDVSPTEEAVESLETENVSRETKNKQKMVPHAALHEERENRKRIDEERKRVAEENEKLRKELEDFRKSQKPAEPENKPDINTDPIAVLNEVKQRLDNRERQDQENSQIQAFTHQVVAAEREFTQSKPDYQQAIYFMAQQRAREMALFGVPQANIPAEIRKETMLLANAAMANGRNPAEVAYQMATQRGYRPASETKPEAQNDDTERLANVQRASKSLSSSAGTPIKGSLSIDDFMRMDSKQVAELVRNDPAAIKRFGGATK